MTAPIPPLAGVAEIAELAGITRQRASRLVRRSGFPAPVASTRSSGPLFVLSDVEQWLASWQRQTGRPRKVEPV